jgi:Fur family peroxide stress response transcriptional regulator
MEKYKNIGLKLTPQRLAVLQYLEGNKSHPSAEEIYRAVKRRFPTISLATIYNILESLKEKGLVQEINIDPYKKRFDPDTTSHHHLICTKCGRIVDIEMDFKPSLPEAEGFRIERIHMEFYGVCRDCSSKGK